MIKPFIAFGSDIKVTQKDIIKRIQRLKRAEEIDQDLMRINEENGYEDPYRAKALYYIVNNKEVPGKLKRKIEEFDRKYKIRTV